MNLKYYLRGLGLGIVMTAIIMGIATHGKDKSLTEEEIIEKAKTLGMIEEEQLEEYLEEARAETEERVLRRFLRKRLRHWQRKAEGQKRLLDKKERRARKLLPAMGRQISRSQEKDRIVRAARDGRKRPMEQFRQKMSREGRTAGHIRQGMMLRRQTMRQSRKRIWRRRLSLL